MLTAADLIHLPYTPDLTEGGIAYALRSLPHTYNRMQGTSSARLRRIVAGVAVELAFRRYLVAQAVPFDVKGATPFTDPDRYDVALGGHRCDIKSFLITYKEQIAEMRRDPGVVLQAPALVPSDQHASASHTDKEFYLFAFLEGLVTATSAALQKAIEAGQRIYLLYSLPPAWLQPRNWGPLGPLALKSEATETLQVELAGQDESRDFLTRRVELPPRTRVVIDDPFFTVSSIHVNRLPGSRIGIHSPTLNDTLLVNPEDWRNIWLYGLDILLTGYISRQEFSDRSGSVLPGTRVFQYDRTRAKNRAVRVQDLHPLSGLLARAKAWGTAERR